MVIGVFTDIFKENWRRPYSDKDCGYKNIPDTAIALY
jgi:hypothetical protein